MLVGAFALNFVLGCFVNSPVTVSSALYGNYFLFYIAAVSGTLFYILLSMKICKIEKLAAFIGFLGKNSIIILCTHWFLLRIMCVTEEKVFGFVLNGFINGSVALLVLLPVVLLCNAHFMFLFGGKISGIAGQRMTRVKE